MLVAVAKFVVLGWMLNIISAVVYWFLVLDHPQRPPDPDDPERRHWEALGTVRIATVPWAHIGMTTMFVVACLVALVTGWRSSTPLGDE